MRENEDLANLCVEVLINNGMDFLIKEAEDFVREMDFYEFSKSQIYGLLEQVDKYNTFLDLKQGVKKWLKNQSAKKSGKNWAEVSDELKKKMFSWDENRLLEMKELAKKKIGDKSLNSSYVFLILKEKNMKDHLKLKLAKSFFYSVLTYYRCYSDNDTKKILEDMRS